MNGRSRHVCNPLGNTGSLTTFGSREKPWAGPWTVGQRLLDLLTKEQDGAGQHARVRKSVYGTTTKNRRGNLDG